MSRVVLVLGMHRSGTSVVARGLQSIGVNLGDRLMMPAPDNPKGFFEDLDLVEIDDRVLEQVGAAWDDPPPFCKDTLEVIAAGRLGTIARERLRSKVSALAPFAFKDPRLSLLLPFWRPVFTDLRLDVSSIVVLRNPLSAAASLWRRNAIPEARSIYMWLRYMLAAVMESDPRWPNLLVEYDSVIAHPRGELEKIAGRLDLSLDQSAAEAFENEFLDERMRHERDEGERPAPYGELLWPTYNLLRDAARSDARLSAADAARLIAYRAEFEALREQEHEGSQPYATRRWVPRSGREKFYRCLWLPRMIDKARRVAATDGSYLIDGEYMFGEHDFADGRLLRFLGVSSAQVLDTVKAEPDDTLASARIIALSGRTPEECETFSRRFALLLGPFLPMIDVDEGRTSVGRWTPVLRRLYNALVARPAIAVFRRAERRSA